MTYGFAKVATLPIIRMRASPIHTMTSVAPSKGRPVDAAAVKMFKPSAMAATTTYIDMVNVRRGWGSMRR